MVDDGGREYLLPNLHAIASPLFSTKYFAVSNYLTLVSPSISLFDSLYAALNPHQLFLY